MIVPFVENEEVFKHAFQQGGGAMPHYRGSPIVGGGFFGRILAFARGLFINAAPHISNLILQGQPHVKKVAAQAVDKAVDKAVKSFTEKLKTKQEGSGEKRKRLKKPILKSSKL